MQPPRAYHFYPGTLSTCNPALTIALGAVETDEDGVPHTRHLRYFSRLCSAAAFIDWVELPLHEAGTAQAGTVVAVQDGADWLNQLLDAHCPDAVRILDFPHAAEHLTTAAQAAYGAGNAETSAWLATWSHTLKHGDPDAVIAVESQLDLLVATMRIAG